MRNALATLEYKI